MDEIITRDKKYCRRIAMLAAKSLSEGHNLNEFFAFIEEKDPTLVEATDVTNYTQLHSYFKKYEIAVRSDVAERNPQHLWSNNSELSSEEYILDLFNNLLVQDLIQQYFWPILVIPKDDMIKGALLKNKKKSKNKNFKTRKAKGTKKYSKNKNLKTRKTKGIKKKNPRRR